MSGSTSFPVVMNESGPVPTDPNTILAAITAIVVAAQPGYTANLPGSLVDDILGTSVAAISLCDSARVELISSVTPYGANAYILNQLGQIYGVQQGQATNTSVNVIFQGPPGFNVNPGFIVSDGTNQYVTQDPATIAASGSSSPVFCVATIEGSWAVEANTVNQLASSVPSSVSLTVNNPLAGTPATATQTEGDYRTAVLDAGNAQCQGMTTMLRTALAAIPGVVRRLVSIQPVVGGGWKVIVGGGDPYQVAAAIARSIVDISQLVGSTINVLSISRANPGVLTTDLTTGFTTGQIVTISGALGMTQINGINVTLTPVAGSNTSFTTNVNTSAFGAYTGGGTISPNPRNQIVTIVDYPDTYQIPFVLPPSQNVDMVVTWNTTSTNIVSASAVANLATTALTNYINALPVGQPINVFELESNFQQAVVSVLPTYLLTRLVFSVSIAGIGVAPQAGTGIIVGDPESSFTINSVIVEQG